MSLDVPVTSDMQPARPRLSEGVLATGHWDIWAIQLQGNTTYYMTLSSPNKYGPSTFLFQRSSPGRLAITVFGPVRTATEPGGNWSEPVPGGATVPDGCWPSALVQQIANGEYKPLDLLAIRTKAIQDDALLTCGQIKTSAESGTGTHYIDVLYSYLPTDTPAKYTLTVHQGTVPGFP